MLPRPPLKFFTFADSAMEKLRRTVTEIAYSSNHAKLCPLHSSLVPVLSFASFLYKLGICLRSYLYRCGLFSRRRLPVPVISVGNLTWGGNGKTPMAEFVASFLADSGISPLILTRGYAGGDEARMLQRHLHGRSVKIGVGANRAATAASLIEKFGYIDPRKSSCSNNNIPLFGKRVKCHSQSEQIGAVIMDDGMQHWHVCRDLDIVMINGLQPWGNCQLLPLGPLREPLTALSRTDVAVVHNADMVPEQNLRNIEFSIRDVKDSISVFFTRMAPSHFFEVGNIESIVPLEAASDNIVFCVSAIGSANAFVKAVEKLGAIYVERFDFNDHHVFRIEDIEMIKLRVAELENKFTAKPIVIFTEKDYDRDPDILKLLLPSKIWVLCAKLQFVSREGCDDNLFKMRLEKLLKGEFSRLEPIILSDKRVGA